MLVTPSLCRQKPALEMCSAKAITFQCIGDDAVGVAVVGGAAECHFAEDALVDRELPGDAAIDVTRAAGRIEVAAEVEARDEVVPGPIEMRGFDGQHLAVHVHRSELGFGDAMRQETEASFGQDAVGAGRHE